MTQIITDTIAFDDFLKVEMRIGRIQKIEDFEKARKPAYKLWIDFGDWGVKQSSAQIVHRYKKEDLIGRLVVAVTNFPKKQIANFFSEVLVLGCAADDGSIVLLNVDAEVPLGSRIC